MGAGAIFGDHLFPVIEEKFGDPLADILLGFVGAFLVAVAYEVVTAGHNKLGRPL